MLSSKASYNTHPLSGAKPSKIYRPNINREYALSQTLLPAIPIPANINFVPARLTNTPVPFLTLYSKGLHFKHDLIINPANGGALSYSFLDRVYNPYLDDLVLPTSILPTQARTQVPNQIHKHSDFDGANLNGWKNKTNSNNNTLLNSRELVFAAAAEPHRRISMSSSNFIKVEEVVEMQGYVPPKQTEKEPGPPSSKKLKSVIPPTVQIIPVSFSDVTQSQLFPKLYASAQNPHGKSTNQVKKLGVATNGCMPTNVMLGTSACQVKIKVPKVKPPPLYGPNGEIIPRKRGRPRKETLVTTPISKTKEGDIDAAIDALLGISPTSHNPTNQLHMPHDYQKKSNNSPTAKNPVIDVIMGISPTSHNVINPTHQSHTYQTVQHNNPTFATDAIMGISATSHNPTHTYQKQQPNITNPPPYNHALHYILPKLLPKPNFKPIVPNLHANDYQTAPPPPYYSVHQKVLPAGGKRKNRDE